MSLTVVKGMQSEIFVPDHTAGCMDSGEERAERYDDRAGNSGGCSP